MENLLKLIFIVILAPCVFSQSAQDSVSSDIKLRTFIESDKVALNREVVYQVEMKWQGDLHRYKINDVLEPEVSNLSARGSGSSNKVVTGSDGSIFSIKRITFYFQPIEMGMSYIEGVTIKYEDNLTAQTESLISSRIGIKIVDPIPEPGQGFLLSELLFIIAIVVVIFLAIYFYFRYKKRKDEESEKALMQTSETIEEKYIRLLKETVHLNTDNMKDSLSDLSHLLSGYFSERYNYPAQNLSTDNFIKSLEDKKLPEDSVEKIKDFYKKANLVKFAGESMIEADFHRLYDIVELVLENQKKLHSEEE